jgi:splicing factor U2AF subunit
MGECVRSGFCNFMHLKPISRELRRDLYGRRGASSGLGNHGRGSGSIGGGDVLGLRDAAAAAAAKEAGGGGQRGGGRDRDRDRGSPRSKDRKRSRSRERAGRSGRSGRY